MCIWHLPQVRSVEHDDHELHCSHLELSWNSHWREAKKSNREEKEKFDILFSNFEKRKRNLKFLSPVSRREREMWKRVLHFREVKEKGIFFSQVSRGEREFFLKVSNFEKRKRNLKFFSPVLRREREIWKSVLHFREEKEKWILFSQDSRGEREFLPGFLKSFPFLQSFANHIVTAKALEKVKVYIVRNVILAAMQCINHGNYFYMSEHPHVWRRLC